MQLASVWTDLYGSTLALYTGRAGGHRWLVATPPEHAGAAAQTLETLDGKGQTVLLVHTGLTPLEAALRGQTAAVLGRGLKGVLVLGQELAAGPALAVPTSEHTAPGGGLHYLEGGAYPAWTDALAEDGPEGECAPASVCAMLGLPVRVCAPDRLPAALRKWWAATPHALEAAD